MPTWMDKTNRLDIHRSNESHYSLVYHVTANVRDGEVYGSHDASLYIANTRNGILESMYDAPDTKTYDADTVIQNREKYITARRAFEAAESALHPFGEYDR